MKTKILKYWQIILVAYLSGLIAVVWIQNSVSNVGNAGSPSHNYVGGSCYFHSAEQ